MILDSFRIFIDSKITIWPLMTSASFTYVESHLYNTVWRKTTKGAIILDSLHNRISNFTKVCVCVKVLAKIPYFTFYFFPHLLKFLQFKDPSYVLNLSTKAVFPEMTYLVHESQIFAVWINFSLGVNWFRRVFLEINHVNLDFETSMMNLTIFNGCIMCIYYIFQFSEIISFSFKCITHDKTKILGN